MASGALGRHNGLPASIIVTTRIAELEAAAGQGLTGDGTVLPISDVIRLAPPRPPLPGGFRQGQSLKAVSQQTAGFTGSANRVVCQGARVQRASSAPGCDAKGYF
nr:DUF222 domain-containing protein [Mycobacterium attenuatum]